MNKKKNKNKIKTCKNTSQIWLHLGKQTIFCLAVTTLNTTSQLLDSVKQCYMISENPWICIHQLQKWFEHLEPLYKSNMSCHI